MLNISNVYKKFRSFYAIEDLSMKIPRGSIFGLLGPNGAGKTTLLRMSMGLLPPTEGKIVLFDSQSPTSREARKRVGYMPQQLAIYPALSVLENLLFYGRLYGVPGKDLKERSLDILELVELTEKRDSLVAHLSGGMIRRVMLATVLIHKPELVILDEPTSGIDPALRIKFWDWFSLLASGGTSVLITTHHIAEASRCEEVLFLRLGKLIDQGAPSDLMNRYGAADLEEAFVRATSEVVWKKEE